MLWWTAQDVLVTAVLCGIVWLASGALKIGPVARHALWLLVLVKFLTPPLVVWPWAIPGRFISADRAATAPVGSPRADARAPARGYDEEFPSDHPVVSDDVAIPLSDPPSASPAPPTGAGSHENRIWTPRTRLWEWILPFAGAVWLAGGLGVAALQLLRVVRMRSLVRMSKAAPSVLSQRVAVLSALLGIRPVRTRVLSGIRTPLIWSLGRPHLLWPAELDPAELSGDSLRGLILHELAHVRRRDHWVAWMELAAGCVWWWNPLFWYVRHQLRENAELACDGWVVQTLPGGRRAYAEALLAVCEFISVRTNPMPAVGVSTGGRRFLERRLMMILRETTPVALSRSALLILGLLAATALPAWSQKSPKERFDKSVVNLDSVSDSLGRVNVAARDESASVREYDGRRPGDLAGADTLRNDVIGRLQTLRDLYAREGRSQDVAAVTQALVALSRPAARSGQIREDPGTLTRYRGHNGESYVFAVTGSTAGTAWGTDVYTDDSSLAVAAVHAGVAVPGRRSMVEVTILPGRSNYEGSTRNGVQSTSYGPWPGSYRVEPLLVARTAPDLAPGDRVVLPDPTTLQSYRDRVGQSFTFDVTGSAEGEIWGSGIYTDDSPLAVAAVHAGLLRPGERGRIRVTILPGRDSYEASTSNGVTSQPFGPFQGSYRIEAVRRLRPDGTVTPTLEHLRDQVGRTIHVRLTGSTEGSVWGSDGVYTDDSSLPAAAVHAGVLKPGEHGRVAITILPGREHYEGSTHNGVTSGSWGSWQGSFRIQRDDQPAEPRTF